MITLTKSQFKQIYKGLSVVDSIDTFYSSPLSDKDIVYNYLPSKLWRLNNLYTIIDKNANKRRFNMNWAQHKVYAASLSHPRIIILKSRQQGISTLWLISFFDDCVFNNNFNSGLMAQGSDEAETLLLRIKFLWDMLDKSIKDFLCLELIKNNTKEFSFSNGSSIFIRTSFRSTTLQRLHISEFGKISNISPQKAREVKTGTLQTIAQGNTTIIESTAEGENMYKNMWDTSIAYAGKLTPKDFKPVFLSWLSDPDCNLDQEQKFNEEHINYFNQLEQEQKIKLTKQQKNFWVMQQRELGKDVFQEYPATAQEAFLTNKDGTYYAQLYLRYVRNRSREKENLFDKNLPVQVSVDLGRNDYFVILFFQTYTDGWRIIDYYKNTGQGIEHYCHIMDELTKSKRYDIQNIILPHDARVRDLTSDMTREDAFRKFGYLNTYVLDKTKDLNNDRELVRQAIQSMFIDTKAQYIIDCFLKYTKEWDDKREIWKDSHSHNEYSHGADAIRYMIKGGKKYVTQYERDKKRRRKSYGIDI